MEESAHKVLIEIAEAVEGSGLESIGITQLALFLREEAQRYQPPTPLRRAFLGAAFPDDVPVELKHYT